MEYCLEAQLLANYKVVVDGNIDLDTPLDEDRMDHSQVHTTSMVHGRAITHYTIAAVPHLAMYDIIVLKCMVRVTKHLSTPGPCICFLQGSLGWQAVFQDHLLQVMETLIIHIPHDWLVKVQG